MEYRYSTKCPVHGQNIETKRTQLFKYEGVSYSGPSFYCTRCRKYYLIIEGNPPFKKLKSTASSGLPIDIRKGVVNKVSTKKKGLNSEQSNKNSFLQDETKSKKTSGGKKNNTARKALIKKNIEAKKRLQESVNQIRCEMNCPNHADRVMTTKNCIDIGKHKNLPLFYCIDCKKYYVSNPELKIKQLGRWNRKDLFNCDCEITTTNSSNGKLVNMGSFNSAEELEKVVTIEDRRNIHYNKRVEGTIQEGHSNPGQVENLEKTGVTTEIEVVKPKGRSIKTEKSVIQNNKENNADGLKDTAEKTRLNKNRSLIFDDWSYEDTEDELFKDFIHKN